ncbi:TAXI family TRAP transporter solute-binding subunit [Chloroflexota bacterium]
MKKIIIGVTMLLVFSLLVLLLPACTTSAPAPAPATRPIVNITYLTGRPVTSGGALGMAMEDITKKNHPWLKVKNASTPGSVYDIKANWGNPGIWNTSCVSAQPTTLYLASKAMYPYEEKIYGYTHLYNLNVMTQFLVTFDPDIKTKEDLIGKRVALSTKASAWTILPMLVFEHGWGTLDQMDIQASGHSAAMASLIDGTTDACVMSVYMNVVDMVAVPTSAVETLLATGKTLYSIPYGEAAVNSVAKVTGAPFLPVTIPEGVLPWLTNDTGAPFETYGELNGMYVKDVFPDEYAYEITKLALEHYKTFGEYHDLGKLMNPEAMSFGNTKKTMASGAVQAYEEYGITIPD